MEKYIRRENISIDVTTVPDTSTQEVAEKMVSSGIKTILNFAPTYLILPSEIKLHNVDLSVEFESLTYYLLL